MNKKSNSGKVKILDNSISLNISSTQNVSLYDAMALPLAINTDDTSCFGNLHRNAAINWFHYIRSLQVFSPKRDIFGCSEDAENEQDSGKWKNPTTINGNINFLQFYWYWCLWSNNFSRYTMFSLFSATGAQCTPLFGF